jgi:hypothetical protein
MGEKIYVLKQKLMYGPYSIETLKEKGLAKDDLIWFEGLKDWQPIKNFKELETIVSSKKTVNKDQKKGIIKRIFSFLD